MENPSSSARTAKPRPLPRRRPPRPERRARRRRRTRRRRPSRAKTGTRTRRAVWRGPDDDEGDRTFVTPDQPSLRDHLYTQLSLTNLGQRDRALIGMLIDALDEDGYLTQSLDDVAVMLPQEAEADVEDLADRPAAPAELRAHRRRGALAVRMPRAADSHPLPATIRCSGSRSQSCDASSRAAGQPRLRASQGGHGARAKTSCAPRSG